MVLAQVQDKVAARDLDVPRRVFLALMLPIHLEAEPAKVELLRFLDAENTQDGNGAGELNRHESLLAVGRCAASCWSCCSAGMGNPGAGSRGETAAGYRAALAQRLGIEIGPGPMFAIILRPGADQFADKEPLIASFQLVNLL